MLPRAFGFGLGRLAIFSPLGMGLVAGFVIFGFLDRLIAASKKEADNFIRRADPKADDFEAALKMAYADGKLDPKEEKLLDQLISESSQPGRLKKAKKKMAKLSAKYGDKLSDQQKLVDRYIHALIYGDDKAAKLLKKLEKRLGDSATIYDTRKTELLQAINAEVTKTPTVFDRFEIALTGVIADDVVNDSELSHLDQILAQEKLAPVQEQPAPVQEQPAPKPEAIKPQLPIKGADIRLADYQGEVSVEPVVARVVVPHSHFDTIQAKPADKNIDKAQAIRTLYQAVSADGKVNKAEIAELRRLIAA